MDHCDPDAEYNKNSRRVSFNFWVCEARFPGAVAGEALDKLASREAGLEADCLAIYAKNWELIHGVAALKLAAALPPTVLAQDV